MNLAWYMWVLFVMCIMSLPLACGRFYAQACRAQFRLSTVFDIAADLLGIVWCIIEGTR